MEPLDLLNNLRIASPCPASWKAMRGDERVRFCDSCAKHVYDISNMKADDAVALIQESEGRLCVRLYRRNDGTVLTADCPVGIRAAVRRRLIRLAAAGVVLLAALRSGIWVFANSVARWVDRPGNTPVFMKPVVRKSANLGPTPMIQGMIDMASIGNRSVRVQTSPPRPAESEPTVDDTSDSRH